MAIGFVLLAVVFGFGTYGLANLMKPHFKKGASAEREAIQNMEKREAGATHVR